MVMGGLKGYVLECESCGREETLVFREGVDHWKERLFKLKGYKRCPECGGKMKVNPNAIVDF